jgi:hypothetical protein
MACSFAPSAILDYAMTAFRMIRGSESGSESVGRDLPAE